MTYFRGKFKKNTLNEIMKQNRLKEKKIVIILCLCLYIRTIKNLGKTHYLIIKNYSILINYVKLFTAKTKHQKCFTHKENNLKQILSITLHQTFKW